MPGWLERIITNIAGAGIAAFFNSLFGAIRQRRLDDDQRELGRKDERLAQVKQRAEALKKMDEVAKEARKPTGDALKDGTF